MKSFITGILLLLCIPEVDPHFHSERELVYNKHISAKVEYCETLQMIVIKNEHVKSKWIVR